MKVLWVTSAYPWTGNPSQGIFLQTQASALSRQGVDVTVGVAVPWIPSLLSRLFSRYAVQAAAPRHEVDGKVEVFRIPYFGSRFDNHLGRPHHGMASQILKHLPFKPDLVHGHMAYPMGLAAVEIARTLGVPSAVTLHGSDVNIFAVRTRLGASRFRRAVAGADQVLCVSRALQALTRQLTGFAGKYLPIGIDLSRFPGSMSRDQARAALDLPDDRPIILYVGSLMVYKGVAVALKALRHPSLAGVLGVFVGPGALAPAVAAQPNCIWRGAVANSMIASYLAAADALILPSFAEGLPTVLVEAGACATPVIATRVGGIPELLQDGRGTLIEPRSAESLRIAILECLASPGDALLKAGRLRDHVRGAFDVDDNAQSLARIYREMLAPGNPDGSVAGTARDPALPKME